MFDKIAQVAKAIAAAAGAAGAAYAGALDGGVTVQEWITVAIAAILAGAGVYAIPNKGA